MQPAAADPRFAEKVRESFARQSFMAHLGARLQSVEPGTVRIVVEYDTRLLQQHGFFHAGVATSIADSAGGYAALSLFPPGAGVLSVEFKVSLLAPAQGERLEAVGRVVKSGRTLSVCDLEVHAVAGERRTLCLKGLQTLMRIEKRPGVVD